MKKKFAVTINDLPNHIWLQIAEYSIMTSLKERHNKFIHNAVILCKRSFRLFNPILYRDVRLHLANQSKCLYRTLLSNITFCKYVKTISFSFDSDGIESRDREIMGQATDCAAVIYRILPLLSNIELLDLDVSRYQLWDIPSLESRAIKPIHISALQKLTYSMDSVFPISIISSTTLANISFLRLSIVSIIKGLGFPLLGFTNLVEMEIVSDRLNCSTHSFTQSVLQDALMLCRSIKRVTVETSFPLCEQHHETHVCELWLFALYFERKGAEFDIIPLEEWNEEWDVVRAIMGSSEEQE
ncbi:hypothetical protein NEOLI_004828 [Neolecta irregularis DAH-3]|uniref:Uncharacterized protein n=1 Tax=Neolecta irregularis (strain DAH-3) TaxID=1198029 RepID=A0A1U7LUZ3_NEOID|nr:hypothetical protein NEOLI_004828 [Neolecta irregularis DAH-3]|eukprot:OLL26464.1 hypothetical protein NEOLI_004828 [Neolecta irregularis DAH-3]